MKHIIYAIPLLLFSPYWTFSSNDAHIPSKRNFDNASLFWTASFDLQDSLITVQGSVKDKHSDAIAGTIVSVKGETINTVSDDQGLFTLKVKPDATLIFNKTDFARQEEPVNNRSEIHVVLKIAEVDSVVAKDTVSGITDTATADTAATRLTPSTSLANTSTDSTEKPQNVVQGTVSDKNGPITGVTVSVKGQPTSAATDEQGRFSIPANAGDILVFSAVGYKEYEEPLSNREKIDVLLSEESKTIESVQVVAVGYGTMERATLASSVSSIGADEIENEVLPSIPQAIQGKAGGVQVTQKSGSPGGGLSIRVRGTTSINASSDPLYVVDGIPVNSTTNFTGGSDFNFGGGTQGINVLSSLNPSDVQSIEILKDAASSSIYGARAANGVVLITTKKGDPGTSQFHFNMYEGYSEMPSERKYEMMNT